MNEYTFYIIALIKRDLDGTITSEQKNELERWLSEDPDNRKFLDSLYTGDELIPGLQDMFSNDLSSVREKVSVRYPLKNPPTSVKTTAGKATFVKTAMTKVVKTSATKEFRWASAAAVLIILGVGSYLFFNSRHKKEVAVSQTKSVPANDILPGGEKAVLTLADGSTIVLDNAANGQLALENGVKIVKKSNGQLVYEIINNAVVSTGATAYNTMRTPRGGQYQLRLPDGTMVWLNAASSITYPMVFNGKDRTVKIEGEAYFEVAKDKTKPFFVDVNDSRIEVLGTSFNVNAYADEKYMQATLLSGSVKVSKDGSSQLLKPGQAAIVTDNIEINRSVDVDQTIAWKNGILNFNNKSLDEVLRIISRWYNVDIVYKDKISNEKIGGEMGSNLKLSDVLYALKVFGLHAELKGRQLLVSSK